MRGGAARRGGSTNRPSPGGSSSRPMVARPVRYGPVRQKTNFPTNLPSWTATSTGTARRALKHGRVLHINGNVPVPIGTSRYGYMERKSMPARPGRLVGSPARSENRGALLQSVARGTGVPPFRAMQELVRAAEASGRGDTIVCLSRTAARTRGASETRLSRTCSTGMPTSAAVASEGVL